MEDLRNNPEVLADHHSHEGEIPVNLKTSLNNEDDHVFVPPKPVENVAQKQENQEIYDLKKMDFDHLVTIVGEKVFVQNLKNIFNFLTSNDDEEEFRDISKHMEEILVRIIRDVDVLKSENIYGKTYCEKIIEILNDTMDSRIYKLVCFFKKEAQKTLLKGLGVNGKNILVYKKLYQSGIPTSQLHGFPSMSSLSSSPPISRSTSMDSLTSQRSSLNITPPFKDHFIPHCFQLIINFVKDTAQQSLELSGLSAEDAKFLHSTFSSVIAGDARGKNVCLELWETVKAFSSRFEFRITYIKAQSMDTKSLLMEKQWMNASSSTNTSSSYSGLIVPMTSKQKRMSVKYGKFVRLLNFDFITHTLESIVNFLSDNAQASLVGLYSDIHEKKFLKCILDLARSDNIRTVFDVQHQRLFSEMSKLLDNNDFKMKIRVFKKKGTPIEIVYMKVPRFENSQKQRERSCERPSYSKPPPRLADPYHQMGRPCASTSRSALIQIPTTPAKAPNINFQAGGLMNQDTSERDPVLVEAVQSHDMPDNIFESLKPKETKRYSQPQTKQSGARSNECIYNKGDQQLIDALSVPVKSDKALKARSKENKPHKKGQQLIDALSVPVRSDKALKMMMGMGWTGGALGTRGDGITEPIMPHLRNGALAGLGHAKGTQIAAKPTKDATKRRDVVPPQGDPPKRTPAMFRKILMESMLELLNSSDKLKTLDFHPSLHKKERTFTRHAIKTFAARTKFKLTDEEQIMVDKVSEHFANDLELTVVACISNDCRQIALTKRHGLSHAENAKLKNINLKLDKNPMVAMHQVIDQFGPLCQKEHALEATKFRVIILLEILSLVKDKKEKRTRLVVDKTLNSRQKNYLDLCLSGVNKRARFGVTTPEVALSIEIKKHIGCYTLSIEFGKDFKTFIISKDYSKLKDFQPAKLDSTGDDIDNLPSDDNEEIAHNDKSDDKIIQKNTSNIDDATENNDHKMEIQNEKDKVTNKNDDLKPQAVNKPDLNISGLAKALKKDNIDKEMKTEENVPESEISMGDETIDNSCDDISMSETSGFTENLDYNETENDINMSDGVINSDKQIKKTLDLSNISASTSNVENDSKIKDVSCIIVYLSKECDVSKEMPKYVQGLISHNIMEVKEKKDLPLLKCHGLHDNFLIYSCHTKKSYDWLQNICDANKITIYTKEFDKMSLKVKTFYDFDEKYLFNLLEMYNEEISTKEWSVLKKDNLGDSVILDVRMDKKSVKSVLESNLELYAGVDKGIFSIIWE